MSMCIHFQIIPINDLLVLSENRDSVVCVVIGLYVRGLRFFPFPKVQASTCAYTASYCVAIRRSLPGDKAT
jgi:hypothetical protein